MAIEHVSIGFPCAGEKGRARNYLELRIRILFKTYCITCSFRAFIIGLENSQELINRDLILKMHDDNYLYFTEVR